MSDFTNSSDLEKLFLKSELIPAIVQDNNKCEVLMLAYMNLESLKKTLEIGETVFWSRSRNEFWHKGETSGHVQRVVSIHSDCDDDTLLIKVEQTGNACHTGAYSCFFKEIKIDAAETS
jgi:phosphoribosyl-AMP cyclohydrolase/phosphoribosyl-ATP pyrophosphohydrolase/phosphoribosyl-AMP cyclohydrolase